MLQWFSARKRKGVAWLLLFLLCFSMVNVPVRVRALEKLGLVGDSFDTMHNVFMIFGRHIFVDNDVWTYKTKAFNVASWECADITNPPSTVKTARLEINQNLSNLEIKDNVDYTKSTYVISGQAFANAFQTLFQDGINGAIANGQKTFTARMYFNNIFQVVHRTTPGKVDEYDGAAMYPVYSFQSPEEYHTASAMAANQYVTSWSASDFAGFYNYPYEYTVNILETKINYVDKKTGKDLIAGADSVYGLKGGTGRYTLPEKTITVGGKSYVYDGMYVIDYKNGFTPERAPSTNGSFSWTIQSDGMEIDVYFTEDTSRQKVPVTINIETGEDGSTYRTDKSFNSDMEVYAGEKFTYTPDPSYQDDEGNSYSYTKKWYYAYTDKDGNAQKVLSVSGDAPNIYPVPKVKDGTSLNVYVQYDKDAVPEEDEEDEEEQEAPIKACINTQITEDGAGYITDKSEELTGTLKAGDEFSYIPPAEYVKGEDTYVYESKWFYSYVSEDGAQKSTAVRSGNPSISYLPKVKEGTVIDINVRYAKEEEEPTLTPTVSPSPTPSPTPAKEPSSNQEAPPNEGSLSRDVAVPTSGAVIESEVKYNHRYDVRTGIATQEDLYAEGNASEFTLGYHLYHVTGTKTYPIRVEKTYILQWEGEDPSEEAEGEEGEEEKEPEILTEEVTVSTTINVTRGYGYWEIGNFQYYIADSMTLYNYALPGGSVAMPVIASKLNPPTASSSDYSENTDDPDTYKYGIKLAPETIDSGSKKKPSVPKDDFDILAYNAAHQETGNIKVRNDYLYYNNGTVLDASWTEYKTTSVNPYPLNRHIGATLHGIFYQGGMVIDAEKDNGAYLSSGNITYQASPASVSASLGMTWLLTHDPNQVVLHTPVYCDGIITADNETYVQLINPTQNAVHLVLDEDDTLNDFLVRVNNRGMHNLFVGYSVRDYSRILRLPESDLSNIEKDAYGNLRNEVKFPFDVYMDVGNDKNAANDVYYPAGTWFTLGRATQRFYLPLTVKEGIYAADFRTIAVNANGRLTKIQASANTDRENYVATDAVLIEVSGRVYGLNVYDITDYPIWEEVFRIPGQLHLKINHPDTYPLGVNDTKYSGNKSYNYTVGTKDRYGNDTGRDRKFTFPLTAGSHPYYGNIGILKRGYTVRFSLDTIGTYYDDSAKVVATPSYYWVDENGQNRTKVDLYYSAEVAGKSRSLIKSGESIDLANTVKYTAGDRKLGVPEEELSITAAIRNLLLWKWEWQRDTLVIGTSRTEMGYVFRTFTGNSYAKRILTGPNKTRVMNAGITEADLTVTKQSWYGENFIPGTAMFVEEGTDVFGYAKRYGIDYTESFWKKDGYIIMNLDIRVYDGNGKARLSYVNKPNEALYCNMWQLEGAPISKSSEGKMAFYFEDGDFMIYSVEQSAVDDYVVGGIY